MPDTFSFKESVALLRTNAKTFKTWLIKEGIDANQQIDLVDPRKKYITKEQLRLLAERHGRTLPTWIDAAAAEPTAITLETLAEQLVTFRAEVMQRLTQIEASVQEIAAKPNGVVTVSDSAQAFQHHIVQRLDPLERSLLQALPSRQETTAPEKAPQSLSPQAPAKATPPAAGGTKSPQKQSKSKATSANKKKTVRGKKLPRTLVALREFASQHGIVTERASAAAKAGKIDIVRGKWLVNSRWAYEALTERGQQDFYHLFHERSGFAPCPQCPHEVSRSETAREVTLSSSQT